MNLKDKVALITGSSRGIGAATAIEFAKQGVRVVIHYNENKAGAEKVLKAIGKENGVFFQADLTEEKQVKQLINKTIEQYSTVDILINNAGAILRPGDWKSDLDTWQKTLDTNLTSAWLLTKEVAPIMQKQKSGSIVNVTSIFGFTGAAPVLAYTTAKGGMITMTKAMAKELAPHIRVNAVAPSNVMTDMTKGAGEELIEQFRQATPLERIAEPKELAKAITFLASDDASYITGEMLVVDGGFSLR